MEWVEALSVRLAPGAPLLWSPSTGGLTMPLSVDEHLHNLIRHIELVQDACGLLARRLLPQGEECLARDLMARGLRHDASKFHGIEWECLHAGPDVRRSRLKAAIRHHVRSNDHHPEYWGG